MNVQPGAAFEAVAKFPTGLVGDLGVRILDNQGATTVARVTAGIAEYPVGSGIYAITLTAPTNGGQYTLAWDDGAGGWAAEDLNVGPPVPAFGTGAVYITRAELKATLNITYDDADTDIDNAVNAASRVIDEALSRQFYLTPGVTRYFDGDPRETRCIIGDWNTVTAIHLDTGADGTFATALVEGTDYDLLDYNAPADGEPFTSFRLRARQFPNSHRNVKIAGDYGWATVPSGVVAYTTILAVQIFQRARQAPFGILVAGIEVGTSARLARVDPDFQRLVGYLDKSQQIA